MTSIQKVSQYKEYLQDCGAPNIVQIRLSSHRATKDLDHGRIKKGDMYDQWVGLIDGEFTVDRVPWKEYYEERLS